jgi:hypothetical protein
MESGRKINKNNDGANLASFFSIDFFSKGLK